jgi:hypothetical protein
MNTTDASASATKKSPFKYTFNESFERNKGTKLTIRAKYGMRDILAAGI